MTADTNEALDALVKRLRGYHITKASDTYRLIDEAADMLTAPPAKLAEAEAELAQMKADAYARVVDARRQALQEAAEWIESVPQSLPDRQHYARCIRDLDKIWAEQ